MIRNVLVPLDGSPFSEEALPHAETIASRSGARLHVVSVHQSPIAPVIAEGLGAFPADWKDQQRQVERAYVQEVADDTARRGTDTVAALLDGPIPHAIREYARRENVDLLVLTSHGRGGVSRVLLGSTADALIRDTAIPILVVRPGVVPAPGASPRSKVLIPLDGSAMSETAVEAALQLAGPDTDVTLLQILVPVYTKGSPFPASGVMPHPAAQQRDEARGRAYLTAVARRIGGRAAAVRCLVRTHPQPASVIIETARELGTELIALATHGRGGVPRAVLGSVADKVVRSAPIPVLVVRPDRRSTAELEASAAASASGVPAAASPTIN